MKPRLQLLQWTTILIITIIQIHNTWSYSMGAPDSSCSHMVPGHGKQPQQTSLSPYHVNVSTRTLKGGERLNVTLGNPDSATPFKGFLLQARDKSDPNLIVGTFIKREIPASILTCGRGIHNTITHNSNKGKPSLIIDWEVPKTYSGTVFFRATFVQEYDTFFVNVTSEDVIVTASDDPELKAAPASSVTQESVITTTSQKTTEYFVPPNPLTTEIPPITNELIYAGCFETKGCFGLPSGCEDKRNCDLVVTYAVEGDKYAFQMQGKSNGYIAVAFSKDKIMGNDSVIECVREGEGVHVYMSWNEEEKGSNVRIRNLEETLSNVAGAYNDGWITCKFTSGEKIHVRGVTYDLSQENVMMIASGAIKDGEIQYHHGNRQPGGKPVFLANTSHQKAETYLLVRLHGAFMIGSWIGLASCGILLARYFKQTWVGRQVLGKDIWFVWHRVFMILTWSLTIAGFSLIFIELEGWTSIPILENPHSVLGCVTTGLAFIQPFMAALRPHPGAPKRAVFNWFHWLVGNLAQICGIVTIFFAVSLPKAQMPEITYWIIVGFVAFHGFMHLCFSIQQCVSDRKATRQSSGKAINRVSNQSHNSYLADKREAPCAGFRKAMLALYLIFNWLFTAVLILLVVLAPIKSYVGDWIDVTVF